MTVLDIKNLLSDVDDGRVVIFESKVNGEPAEISYGVDEITVRFNDLCVFTSND